MSTREKILPRLNDPFFPRMRQRLPYPRVPKELDGLKTLCPAAPAALTPQSISEEPNATLRAAVAALAPAMTTSQPAATLNRRLTRPTDSTTLTLAQLK